MNTSQLLEWLRKASEEIATHRDELTRLDAAIGDADHGINMVRGFGTVMVRVDSGNLAEKDASSICKEVGMALVSSVGGASGPLYGTFFLRFGSALGGSREFSAADFATGFRAGVDGVRQRGKAAVGDKTMLDALVPAADALENALAGGKTLSAALSDAEEAARNGSLATAPLVARKGRASYLGERSAGHQDPGATSAHLIVKAAAEAFSSKEE